MFYVYVLKSLRNDKRYIGSTGLDPEERLKEHNSGKLKNTRGKIPWILWHIRKNETMEKARLEEIYLKKKNRQVKESLKNV